jgi:two-component system LytT family response regulator
MFKVLVADDEKIARNIITLLLADQPEIGIVEEAKDGIQVLEKVKLNRPDILFLDIQMPGFSGIELAEKLDPRIVVVFVTAYDEYAIAAFKLNATDYLLKPFVDERFYSAWHRATQKVKNSEESDYSHLGELIDLLKGEHQQGYKTRLFVKEMGRIKLVDIDQINFISGAGNYAELHLLDGTVVLHRETLSVLEQQLDPEVFIRLHRSTIARRVSIEELRPNEKGDYTVFLKSGDKLTLSRRNKSKLHELLN